MDVHLSAEALDLVNPDDVKGFSLVTDLTGQRLRDRVAAVDGLALADPAGQHVWVAAELVTRLAGPSRGAGSPWAADFEAMVGYAQSRGWTSEQGVRAHVVHP